MDHFKNPRNCGHIENPDFAIFDENPSCGDRVSMQGKVQDSILVDVKFISSGCVLSQATSSMLTEFSKGKKIEEILAMTSDDILKLVGINLGPNRIKCAMLPLIVLKKGLSSYFESKIK